MTRRVSAPSSALIVAALLVSAFVMAVAAVGLAPGAASASPGVSAGAAYPYPTLGLPPAGANDWSCEPTAQHPYPAVIVHGTFGDQKSLLDNLSLSLKRGGYCVYALDYGNRATGPIEESAAQLGAYVDRVLASTGAAKVHLVGHSQGGMMPRYFIKNLGGEAVVEDLVGIAPSNHGTTITSGFPAPGGQDGGNTYCVACDQQATGSPFLTELNNPDETPGDVDYTQVVTKHDEVVVPYTSGFLTPGPHSTNITAQERCALDLAEHGTLAMDPQTIAWVLNAFGREGPADPAAGIGCRG
jgi:triacylglycerol esterase/lipase EstA (alpha/beta hydrolase family)